MSNAVNGVAPTPQPSSPPPSVDISGPAEAQQYATAWQPASRPVPAPAPSYTPKPAPAPVEHHSPLDLGKSFVSDVAHGDVSGAVDTARPAISPATGDAQQGISTAVTWTGQQIHDAANLVRDAIPGDNILSNGLRGAIIARFDVSGVSREVVRLAGAVTELGTSPTEMQLSPKAAMENGQNILGEIEHAATAGGRYLDSVVHDPGRVLADAKSDLDAAGNAIGGRIDNYKQTIQQGRGPTIIGMDVGAVTTDVVPVGGGPLRSLVTGVMRAGEEGLARAGGEMLDSDTASAATRHLADAGGPAVLRDLKGIPGQIARSEPPAAEVQQDTIASKLIYGKTPSAGTGLTPVSDAETLDKLGLTSNMLDSGAFRAEVYRAPAIDGGERYIVAMRGTRPTGIEDRATDIEQGVGMPMAHYEKALEIGKAVARADPEQKLDISFTGHSLGGGLAALAARASGREAVTFNAAGVNNASMREERTFLDAAGIAPGTADNYVVQGEVLTGLQESLSIPRAFGNKDLLDLVPPEGKSPSMRNAPIIGPINRHTIDWVLAGVDKLGG